MKRAKQSQSPASTPQLSTSKKYRSAGQTAGFTSSPNTTTISTTNPQPKMLGESRFSPSNSQTSTNPNPFPFPHYKTATQTTATLDEHDRSSVSDNDSCTSPCGLEGKVSEPSPAPGKKTRGRVKIEMQYIQNKLRRYTTFSKRKSGMMKKAYELSTLTGTQVMLLVASETGHVYTFATPKLQPMITSDAGKALIQTCLHTPDPPQAMGDYDMRMCATGYEETELGYSISDDDAFKTGLETSPPQMVSGQGQQHMPQMMGNSILTLPPGMMQVPFQLSEHQQTMMQSGASYPNPAQTMSPHTHSPPPSYSPNHPTSSPRSAYPTSPTSAIPYSQSSHMTHPHMLMEDHHLTSGSPLRKSPPENHYLPHHHQYDRSPSSSPMAPVHYPVRTRSPPQGSVYTQQSGSPTNHSPMGHL